LREQRQELRQARRQSSDRQGQKEFTLASKVIGMQVKAKGDEAIGEIRNLLINEDGQVEYLAVSTSAAGGTAASATPSAQIIQPDRTPQADRAPQADRRSEGAAATATAGGKLTLIPWDVVKLQQGEAAGQGFVMVEIEKDRLMTAPSFSEQQLTAQSGDTQWTTQVDQFFNVRSQRGAARPELDRDRSQQQDRNRPQQGTQPRSGEAPRSDSSPGADSTPRTDDN